MTVRCIDPSLGDAVLERARPDALSFEPSHLSHLESCGACRVSVRRLRRLAATWQALEPTPAETRSARTRFVVRARKRGSVKVLPKAAALVVVLAAAVASAAVRVVAMHFASPVAPVTAPDDTPTSVAAKKAKRHFAPVAAPPAATIVAAPPPAEISIDDLPASPAPTLVPVPLPPHHALAPASMPSLAPTPALAPTPPKPNPWVLAASAMRVGDYAAAEAAFDDLARSSDPPGRDAARLARAQVWIAQGRTAQARPDLQDLAASGATALVRKQAADALETLP